MEKSKKKLFVGLSIAVIFVVSAGIAYFTNPPKIPNDKTSELANINQQKTYNIPIDGNFSFGAENPKITIIEFADFNCPYCKNSYSTIRQIGYKYKDQVKIIFKDYPIIQESSADIALAARCAGEQGLFWGMHDKLFAYQGQFELTDLPKLATEIGADNKKFNTCVSNKKYLNEINKDLLLGQEMNLNGTPKFFVNGYLLPGGDLPIEAWDQIIQFFLANEQK
jgi:protein-disulfide isomerase